VFEPTPPTNATDDPFARLTAEHVVVESLLRVIDALVKQAESGKSVDRLDLADVVDFLTDFGELGHHEKEEGILTPVLIAKGFDWFTGPLASVRREHRQEHYFYRVLGQLARQAEAWSAEDGRHFVSVARECTAFLRAHMKREEHDLFQLAKKTLPPQSLRELCAAFDRFDQRPGAAELKAKLEEQRRRLLDKYSAQPR
jgi:hemerythrin-like domain-containing protein